MLFILVDAYSKWLEVVEMKKTTTSDTLKILERLFERYGLCEEIVSDNGTQFTSEEFAKFCGERGIKHIRTAPGHPQSNGQAERYVDTVKTAIRKGMLSGKSLPVALHEFLSRYRSTKHSTTDESPAQLFLGRPMRTLLDLVKPEVAFVKSRERQKRNFDMHTKVREFKQEQLVLAKEFRANKTNPWAPGKLIKPIGKTMWEVLVDGNIWRRHANQLMPRSWLTEEENFEARRLAAAQDEKARSLDAASNTARSEDAAQTSQRSMVAAEQTNNKDEDDDVSEASSINKPVHKQPDVVTELQNKQPVKVRKQKEPHDPALPVRKGDRERKEPSRLGEWVKR